MMEFDPSQLEALALDPGRHARILGAPGSGKTTVLTEAFGRAVARSGWREDDVLVMAPDRLVAADLRRRIERSAQRVLGGTPVRTAASLAFAVLSRAAAVAGEEPPRLLTGTVQDEEITSVVEAGIGRDGNGISGLVPEVLLSPVFRGELRELWRVLDDFDLDPLSFSRELAELAAAGKDDAHSRVPDTGMLERWQDALQLIEAVSQRLARGRPGELSSSALLRAAAAAVRSSGIAGPGADAVPVSVSEVGTGPMFRVPRLLLVDDAQELGEGELALLAACASVGTMIWAFGDPDIGTGAFHGERAGVLSNLSAELGRRGGSPEGAAAAEEQLVVLRNVHRHGDPLRGFVQRITSRVGTAGAGEQRSAGSAETVGLRGSMGRRAAREPEFVAATSAAEQLGIIAHRLRARHLGVGGGEPVAWEEMAVVCRSRAEAARVARALAVHQVPTGIAAGGIVLREHQIVRELVRVLQHSLGIAPFASEDVLRIVGGVIGGLDPVAIRRLRGALLLQERRAAASEARSADEIDALVLEAFTTPGERPIIDSPGGRRLRALGLIAAAGTQVHEAGGTPRETLWAIWNGTRLAERWQSEALESRGARADEADRSLDAVLGLFFALQRHEEQDSEQPIAELLDELLLSTVPEDSLAGRGQKAAVTVTTPQGAVGQEFSIVAITGLQDGSWPNLRARGSLLGTAALERWLRGGLAAPPSRRDTIHDELRLFAHSCARARDEVLVVAVSDEEQHPSAFFGLGREHLVDALPSARLTLRGATAEMRRRLVADPDDGDALRALVALANEGVPGAHPDEWYGVLPPSTDAPLHDLEADPGTRVPVSPSQLERAENCPLDWAVAQLGGGTGNVQASLGTLVHHALETAQGHDPAELLGAVLSEWNKLPFEAEWQSERLRRLAESMSSNLAAYLRDFDASERRLVGRETAFSIPIGRAELRGTADRLELSVRSDGETEVTVLDLKTGRTPPSRAAAEEHAQLQAYQLGVEQNAFALAEPGLGELPQSGGARLLYVHPDAAKTSDYVERVQQPMSQEARERLMQRVADIAEVMASGTFEARVERHCSDRHQPGECRLHIIPAVSRA